MMLLKRLHFTLVQVFELRSREKRAVIESVILGRRTETNWHKVLRAEGELKDKHE